MTTCAVRMCQQCEDGITLDIYKKMTLAIINKAVLVSDIKLELDEVGDALTLTYME